MPFDKASDALVCPICNIAVKPSAKPGTPTPPAPSPPSSGVVWSRVLIVAIVMLVPIAIGVGFFHMLGGEKHSSGPGEGVVGVPDSSDDTPRHETPVQTQPPSVPGTGNETTIPKMTIFQPEATSSAPELAMLLKPSAVGTGAAPLLVSLPATADLRLPMYELTPAYRIQLQRSNQVVDRFILYDTGQLPGQPGQIALMQFNQLGLESLPSLLLGLERTSNLQASCPFIVLSNKVRTLLAMTNDYQVLLYASEMLAKMDGGRYQAQLRALQVFCEQRLKQLDRRAQIPQWIKALSSPNVNARRAAAGGLGQLGADARPALAALAKAFNDPDEQTRGLAAAALVAIGPDTAPAFVKALKDAPRRRLAASALAAYRLPPEAVIPDLIALLKDPDVNVRDYTGAVLARWGRPAALPLTAALDDPQTRAAAAPVLGQIRPVVADAIPRLVEGLADPDEAYRVAAHNALVNMGKASVPALAKVVESPDSRARYSALLALGRIGPDAGDAILALTAALHDPDRNVRFLAVAALVKIDPTKKAVADHLAEAVPILVDVLRHEQAPIRAWAASVLGVVGPGAKPAAPALATRVEQDEDARVRVSAAQALGHMGAVEGVPTLIAAQADKDATVRGAVANALLELGPTALPSLIDALAHSRAELRAPSAEVLERIGKPAAGALAQATADANPERRRAALGVLEKIGAPASDAVPSVTAALKNEDAGTRSGAIRALAAIEPGRAATFTALLGAAADADGDVADTSVKSLRGLALDAAFVLAITPFLKEGSAKQRSLAAELLQKLGPMVKNVTPALLEARADKDTAVRAAVLKALAAVAPQGDDALAAQVAALHDPEPAVASAAADALVHGGARAVPPLIEALGDRKAGVRRQATIVLRNLGVPARPAMRVLTEHLADEDASVRAGSIQALSAIEPASAALLTHCVTASAKDSDKDVRAAAHVALLAAPRDALPLLGTALADKDVAVRRAAIETIKTIAVEGHAEKEVKAATWDLLAALKDDDKDVCEGAGWALGEIDPELKANMPELVKAMHQPAKKGASPIAGQKDFRLIPMTRLAEAAELETGERKQDLLAELRQRRGTPILIALARAAVDSDKETRTRGRTSLLMYLTEKPNPKEEDAAAIRLRLYKRLAEDGKGEAAQKSYRQLIQELPRTQAAEEARGLLAGR
jgi:HEAT repeat protein